MRWDALLSEIWAQEADRHALERDAEARELARGAWSERTWASGLDDLDVTVRATGERAYSGRVTSRGSGWFALDAVHEDIVVADGAVVQIEVLRPAEQIWPDPEELSPIVTRLGWGHVFRAIADAGDIVTVDRMDGSTVRSPVDVVGRDFVRLDRGETRPIVPFSAISAVRIPR